MELAWKLAALGLFNLLLAAYAVRVVRPLRAGGPRIAAALPLIAACLLIPLLLSPWSPQESLLITPVVRGGGGEGRGGRLRDFLAAASNRACGGAGASGHGRTAEPGCMPPCMQEPWCVLCC